MDVRAFVEFVRAQCAPRERPLVGTPPARLTYLTVQCADGQRVPTVDLNKRAGSVMAGRLSTHRSAGSHEHDSE